MEVVEKPSLFPDIQANDRCYLAFMQDLREEMSSVVSSRCTSFCYNFVKDQPFDSQDQSAYLWDSVKPEEEEAPGYFAYPGRVSMASLDTLSTFPTSELDPDGPIPNIPSSRMGRTSLTNEDFVNELPEQIQEDPEEGEEDEGVAHRVPYQSSSTSGGLPFRRQV